MVPSLVLHLFHGFAEQLGAFTSAVVANLLHVLFGAATTIGPEGYTILSHPSFLARIGPSCWGMDGFTLFTIVYLTAFVIYRRQVKKTHWLLCLAVGYVLTFTLNVARILVLFSVCVALGKLVGTEQQLSYFKSVIHPNLGWLIYGVGLSIYFFGFVRYFAKPRALPRSAEPVFSPSAVSYHWA